MTATIPDRGPAADLTSTSRLEAFSDGVFAIAITLLVLEIKVPHEPELVAAGGLWPALGNLWPSYLGYALSFATLGIMWANHHAMFQYIRRSDRRFLMVNVAFLMAISFVPFPTAVLAEHLPHPDQRTAATVFYSSFMVVMALLYNAVWHAGIREGRLLGDEVREEAVRTITHRYRFGPVLYLATALLALASVWLSLALHVALAILYALSEHSSSSRGEA
jgi:TMEM175 potassium channel family protein